MKKAFNPAIFRDYDIRGLYPQEVNEEVFYLLGRAIATYAQAKEIAVGYDARLSSPSLFESLAKGLQDQGTDVVELGMISTEMHYFASGKYLFPFNLMITASHNPASYNGLKIVRQGVVPLHGKFGLPEIKKLFLQQEFPLVKKRGKRKKFLILKPWLNHALSFIKKEKLLPLKVVIDAGNGVGGISWQALVGKLPLKIIPLYFEPDGSFPHHLPDPLKAENLFDLQKKIVVEKADLGLALDGDGDRLFALDEKGKVLSGTVLTAILASFLLKKFPGEAILYTVTCGQVVPETVEKLGGRPLRVRVGHSFIKEKMREENALFAGEHSGHFYFRENFFAESSLIAGLLLLEYLSQEKKSLSLLAAPFQRYPASGELSFRVKDPREVLARVRQEFSNASSLDTLDGLSVFYPNWWFNLRPSNTEPLLRLNLEADSQKILAEKLEKIKKLLQG